MSSEALSWAFEQRRQDPVEQLLLIGMGDSADIHHNVEPTPLRYLRGAWPIATSEEADRALDALLRDGVLVHALNDLDEPCLRLTVPLRRSRKESRS